MNQKCTSVSNECFNDQLEGIPRCFMRHGLHKHSLFFAILQAHHNNSNLVVRTPCQVGYSPFTASSC